MNFLLGMFPGKWWLYAVAAGVIFASGASGAWWVQSRIADSKELAELQARESDAIQQRKFGDVAATGHAKELATINKQLGNAREKVASLSGRECLDAGTVGMLNAIGGEPVSTPPGQPASAAATIAVGGGLRFATERDVGRAIATCRAGYAELSSQLNQILDIEDQRQAPKEKAGHSEVAGL